MDDAPSIDSINDLLAPKNKLARGWQATLTLEFTEQDGRSYLAKRQHSGPLVIQKTLHPEGAGVCHGIVVHPPGGVAGGDELTLNVRLNDGAHILLTTPGAGKWYKANGKYASQHLNIDVQNAACFEWLPQENILFDGAKVKFSAKVNLAADAKYAGWEILCFGRQAQEELWRTGSLHQNLSIRRENECVWKELACLKPKQQLMHSIVGLGSNAVSASFVIVAGAVPPELLVACKEIQPKLALDLSAKYGVTALPEVFSARYVGQSAQCARQYFEQLWQIMRPWYAACEVTRPRIWNT
jgi:urease accessory protein